MIIFVVEDPAIHLVYTAGKVCDIIEHTLAIRTGITDCKVLIANRLFAVSSECLNLSALTLIIQSQGKSKLMLVHALSLNVH